MNKESIERTIKSLRNNHFDVYFAQDTKATANIFFNDIFPGLAVQSVSWSNSETIRSIGVLDGQQQPGPPLQHLGYHRKILSCRTGKDHINRPGTGFIVFLQTFN